MYSGLIFLAFASFLETNSPIKTETEISSPYHLITINSIETIEDGSYKVNIENDNGEITTEAVPVGPQLIVKAQDKINVGDPLTNDPNVGGFGQLDAEVVLQSPYRVIGLIAFFIGVGLTQILLVLKKKQVEKVQAAEGI